MHHFAVGLLMSIYPIAFLVSAPLVGEKLNGLGRKNVVLVGVLLATGATLMFGFGGYCKNIYAFFAVSFIARLLQGVADAFVCITIPSIIILEYPDEQEMYIGYVGMSMGAGLCLGPLIGSLVFRWLNYVDTFYFFTAYMFIFGLTSVVFIPSKVND